jgi:hypothetical protein
MTYANVNAIRVTLPSCPLCPWWFHKLLCAFGRSSEILLNLQVTDLPVLILHKKRQDEQPGSSCRAKGRDRR